MIISSRNPRVLTLFFFPQTSERGIRPNFLASSMAKICIFLNNEPLILALSRDLTVISVIRLSYSAPHENNMNLVT